VAPATAATVAPASPGRWLYGDPMTAEPRAVSAELDATDQAALVRSGEVSPRRTGRGRHRPGRAGRPRAERHHPPALRRGAGRGRCAGSHRGCVPGGPDRAQGPRRLRRRPTAPPGHPLPARPQLRRHRRLRAHGPVPGRRHGGDRPDQHARAGSRHLHRARGLRPHPEPVGHRSLHRWVERWVGGRGGIGDRGGRPRRRRRRIHPHPGVGVRPRRAQAQPRPHHARPRAGRGLERPGGPARRHPHRAGHGGGPRRRAGSGGRRPVLGAASGAAVPERGGGRPGIAPRGLGGRAAGRLLPHRSPGGGGHQGHGRPARAARPPGGRGPPGGPRRPRHHRTLPGGLRGVGGP
jgi:hypothetical protein